MWTLCYEEQFYAVAGIILLINGHRFFEISCIITFLCVFARALAYSNHLPIEGLFFDGHWTQFALGIYLYRYVNYLPQSRKMVHLLIAAAVLGGAVLGRHHLPSEVDRSTVAAGLFMWVLMVSQPWDHVISTSRWLAPFRYCGTICFSMYLVHWPICKLISHAMYLNGIRDGWSMLLIAVPLSLASSIVVAACFYHLVERRFLNVNKPTSETLKPASTWKWIFGNRVTS